MGTDKRNGLILVVDDAKENLMLLEVLLEDMNYETVLYDRGEMALKSAQEDVFPDLALLDITMPGMSGYELCVQLKKIPRMKEVPIIFISALTEALDKVKAFSLGGVDYITKPFNAEELKLRITTHINMRNMRIELEGYNYSLKEKVNAQVKEISEAQVSTIIALAELSETRDAYTGSHLDRIQVFSKMLAKQILESDKGRDEIDEPDDDFINNIFYASALHDVGKVAVPDRILNKNGRLTPEEFEFIKMHPTAGADVLKKVIAKHPTNSLVVYGESIARFHHEKWDGTGYPYGIKEKGIPIAARIVAVADVYDAIRSKRQYKPAMTHIEAMDEIIKGKGSHFDPLIVDAFIAKEEGFSVIEFDFDVTY